MDKAKTLGELEYLTFIRPKQIRAELDQLLVRLKAEPCKSPFEELLVDFCELLVEQESRRLAI